MTRPIRSALLLLVAATLLSGRPAQADEVDTTRQSLARYVETRQIISRERQDWELGKEVLEQRIALLEGEIGALRGKIAEARSGLREVSGKQGELTRDNRELRDAAFSLQSSIGALETSTRSLLKSVPEPLADRVEPLARKLPAEPFATQLSLSQRFQNVLGVLNEVNKFNREMTLLREIRELPDGSTSEVQTLYLGLAQAYYVTPDGESAGTGHPGRDGWSWRAADQLADEITQAIAIMQNEEVPAYVSLPVEVQ